MDRSANGMANIRKSAALSCLTLPATGQSRNNARPERLAVGDK
jgi:hypothetical protein